MLQAGNTQAFTHKMYFMPDLLIEVQFKNAEIRFDLNFFKKSKKIGTIFISNFSHED